MQEQVLGGALSRQLSFSVNLASLKLFTQTFDPASSLTIDALNPDDICPTRSGTRRRLQLTTCGATFISRPSPCTANVERVWVFKKNHEQCRGSNCWGTDGA